MMAKRRKVFRIYGRTIGKETGLGLPGLKVKAVDKDLLFDDVLGEVETDARGNFEIVYEESDFRELFFDNKPDIYLRIKNSDGLEIFSTEEKVRYGASDTEEFIVHIPDEIHHVPELKFEISVLRPEDMLNLTFSFINIRLEEGMLKVKDEKSKAWMIVEFPPQNIAEEAFFESAQDYDLPDDDPDASSTSETPYYPCKHRIAENSRLVFSLPKDAEIEYSVEGLLDACGKYDLQVAPTASPPLLYLMADIKISDLMKRVEILKEVDPGSITMNADDLAGNVMTSGMMREVSTPASGKATQWSSRTTMKRYLPQKYDIAVREEIGNLFWEGILYPVKPKIKKPTGLETSIEAPYRLIISPNKYAAWAHTSKPVNSLITSRYELWHTRYAVRLDNKINEQDDRLRKIRAIWARDLLFDPDNASGYPPHYPSDPFDNPFRMSLDAFDRHNIVHLTADNYIDKFQPSPVDVNRLMLTSLGAWVNFRGNWEPPTMLSVEEWKHRGTMGRDHYVKVVYKGYLFPFGHRASLVKVTERKFHPQVLFLLYSMKTLFEQKMKSSSRTYRLRSGIDSTSFINSISNNFEKEVSSLLESMDGRSGKDIQRLVRKSKEKFSRETASLVRAAGEKADQEFMALAEVVKKEFHKNIDLLIEDISKFVVPGLSGNIAYLRQRMYIVVRKPERVFVNSTGLKDNGKSYDLQFPFWNVEITTLVTPDLDDPVNSQIGSNGQSMFWPTVGNERFQFHIRAKDFSDNEVEFTAPLIFVEQTVLNFIDNNAESPALYNGVVSNLSTARGEYETDVKPDFNSQSFMYADSAGDPGKTTFETRSVVFSALVPAGIAEVNKLRQNLGDDDLPPFYPAVHKANVVVPSVKHLAGTGDTVEIQYEDTYLTHGFDGNINRGEVFVKLTDGLKLDFNSQGNRSGGLVKPNMDIQGLSRLLGPVAGSGLTNIAGGSFDPEDFFGSLDAKIFGVIDLWDILQLVLPSEFVNKLKNVLTITPDMSSGELKVELKWEPELKDWNNLFIASNGDKDASLTIGGEMIIKSSGDPEVSIYCTMKDFSVDLLGNVESFIIIHFDDISFKYTGGQKADVDVNLDEIEFVGILSFVETLKDFIPMDGFSDPPSLDVTEEGITAGFSLGLPDIAVGVMSIENISLGASFTIPFIADPLSVRFNFCDRHSQFNLTVSLFGGGGFFAITLDPKGVQVLEAAFEFGAKISVNFGVASGGVYVMAGIYFRMEMNPDKASLTGYFRMGGNVSVLGIISVSIELYLSLEYEFYSGKCVGTATLTIEVEVLFFSVSVEITCEKKFAGSNGDPSFRQLMEAYIDPGTGQEVDPWEEYCEAFA